MITFLVAILSLVLGYFIYGKYIERFFGADDSIKTPAIRLKDNVDFIVMPTWKMFTIQFLNIAGLGPIFGAILGAMYGTVAYIWIVFGCILWEQRTITSQACFPFGTMAQAFPKLLGNTWALDFKIS
jgi:carbon starvation protein CstA